VTAQGKDYPRSTRSWITVLCRLSLGAVFLYMGLNKALDPVGFLKLVRQYDMVQGPPLLNLIAVVLPWFEVFCGVLLMLGIAVKATAVVSILMLVPFTVIVIQRTLKIQALTGANFCSIRFDCGCGAGEVLICAKIAENAALTVLAALLLKARELKLCLRASLF
jgi:uncharacterized membrane protein YphA (DoxX/SURF4 family)